MFAYNLELLDLATGEHLNHGGKYVVSSSGSPARVQLYNEDGSTLAQPVTISGGQIKFFTLESVTEVDVFGLTDKGYSIIAKKVKPQVTNYRIDRANLAQTVIFPFRIATGAIEGFSATAVNQSGFIFASNTLIMPQGLGVHVTTNESGKAIDVGVKSTSGVTDDDGLIDGLTLATAVFAQAQVGYIVGTNSVYVDLTGGDAEWSYGALFSPANAKGAKAEGTDSATTKNGLALIRPDLTGGPAAANLEELTFQFTATPTAVAGYIVVPTRILQPDLS